jgi:hypothetical protein
MTIRPVQPETFETRPITGDPLYGLGLEPAPF